MTTCAATGLMDKINAKRLLDVRFKRSLIPKSLMLAIAHYLSFHRTLNAAIASSRLTA